MISEETLVNINLSCKEFAASMVEKFDLDYFQAEVIKHTGYKIQVTFNGAIKAPEPERDKLIYNLGQHNLPFSIVDETFAYGGKELKIVDVQIHLKPIIAMDVNSTADRYRFTVKQIRAIFENHLLNAMALKP